MNRRTLLLLPFVAAITGCSTPISQVSAPPPTSPHTSRPLNPSDYIFTGRQAINHAKAIVNQRATEPHMRAALNTINENEGTGFVLVQGSANTLTDDGLTWGFLGFTSYDADMYHVLESGFNRMNATQREELKQAGNSILAADLGSQSRASSFAAFEEAYKYGYSHRNQLGIRGNTADRLAAWGLYTEANGRKRPWKNVQAFFGWLGSQPYMIDAQWQRIEQKYSRASDQAKRALGGNAPSAIAKELFFDIYTFSNGLNDAGWSELERKPWTTEKERMHQATSIVLARLERTGSAHYQNCKTRWSEILRQYD